MRTGHALRLALGTFQQRFTRRGGGLRRQDLNLARRSQDGLALETAPHVERVAAHRTSFEANLSGTVARFDSFDIRRADACRLDSERHQICTRREQVVKAVGAQNLYNAAGAGFDLSHLTRVDSAVSGVRGTRDTRRR